MHSISDERRAFAHWLRTGRYPHDPQGKVEVKYNHWHDPENGRFTYANSGRHDGGWTSGGFTGGGWGRGGGAGASGSGDWPASSSRHVAATRSRTPKSTTVPRKAPAAGMARGSQVHVEKRSGAWTGGEFTGGGGGSFGGAGASGNWGASEPTRRSVPSRNASAAAANASHVRASPPANKQDKQFRTILRNGYAYQIDSRGRTRRVSGRLKLTDTLRQDVRCSAPPAGLIVGRPITGGTISLPASTAQRTRSTTSRKTPTSTKAYTHGMRIYGLEL